MDSKQ